MKKQISAIITAALIFGGLTACSSTPGNSEQDSVSQGSTESSSNESNPDTSFLGNTESEADPNNSSSDFDYDYVMEHRYDNVIKMRGAYGETEIPDIHYENADFEGRVTHSPFGDEWQYYGLESMVFETHTLGGYTIKLIGHNVRTDKEYFPNTIFGSSFGFEVEKDGVMITKGGYSLDLTSGAGAQFYPEELIFTDKIGSYLDVYDLKYPVIAMSYYFGDNPERLVQKCVQFGFLLNNEAVCGFGGVCEPGCGIALNQSPKCAEALNVINSGFTNCVASVFDAEEFKVIDGKTLFDEIAGITYTFNFDIPLTTIEDVPFEMYTAEKTAGSVAAAFEQNLVHRQYPC